jgi:hypothetical protein
MDASGGYFGRFVFVEIQEILISCRVSPFKNADGARKCSFSHSTALSRKFNIHVAAGDNERIVASRRRMPEKGIATQNVKTNRASN